MPNELHLIKNLMELFFPLLQFNWYTRRVGLASIYKATELYMLQDNSQDFEKTWKFLGRRVEEARILHDFLIKSEHASVHIQNAVGSTFSTVSVGWILMIHFETILCIFSGTQYPWTKF